MTDEALLGNVISLLTGFGGAIVGAFVSGYVAKSQTREIRKNQQKAEFFKLMIKSSLIQTDFANLQRMITDCIEIAKKNGNQEMALFGKVQSNPGDFDKIVIHPDELTCLFEAREFNLLSDVVELALKHTRLFEAFNAYSRLRSELKDMMPNNEINGSVVGSNLTADEIRRLQPRFLELGSLIDSVVKLLPEYVSVSESVCSKIGPAAQKFFGDQKFPTLAAT